MTGIDALKQYMTELDWSAADLADHCTVVNLSTITGLLSGDDVPTYIQMMHIINQICKQYPSDRHWGIYQSIMIAPIFTDAPHGIRKDRCICKNRWCTCK